MTMENLRSVVHRAPFQPFTIYLADGHERHVPHPDFLTLAGGGGTAVLMAMQGESFTVIDLSLITRLQVPAVPRVRRRQA